MSLVGFQQKLPLLLLAVLAAAAAHENASLHVQINQLLLNQNIATRLAQGEKSLEMVQSLLLASTWYCLPVNFEHQTFSRYIYLAADIVLDLFSNDVDDFDICSAPQTASAHILDLCRAMLGCYLSCSTLE